MTRDVDIRRDIARLVDTRPRPGALDAAPAPAPILAKTALGPAARKSQGEAGISSPLAADSVTSESRTLTSSDGLFSLTYDHWLVLTCHDAESREVVIDLSALA